MDVIKALQVEQLRTDLPDLLIGDTARVHVKVKEGTRERFRCLKEPLSVRNMEGFKKLLL